MSFIHARTFDTRWGQGLAFLDNDQDYETEVLILRCWAPLCDDGSLASADVKIGLKGEVSEASADAMAEANRGALITMDAARFEAVIMQAGAGAMLDRAFARWPA